MCGQRGKNAQRALETVYINIPVIFITSSGRFTAEEIGIDAMDHVDGVPTACKFVGQSLHVNSISTKVKRRVKGRNHAKAKRPTHNDERLRGQLSFGKSCVDGGTSSLTDYRSLNTGDAAVEAEPCSKPEPIFASFKQAVSSCARICTCGS